MTDLDAIPDTMSYTLSTPSSKPRSDGSKPIKHDSSVPEAPAAADDTEDLTITLLVKIPTLGDPFLKGSNPANSSLISTAFSPQPIWDSSPLRPDSNADSGDEWHSAPSSICSSPCASPLTKPTTEPIFEDNEEDLDVNLERLVESCLQCQLKCLPCNKGLPSCSRCLRVNGEGEPCLAQRRLAFSEMRVGLGIGGFVVPIRCGEREGEETLRAKGMPGGG
ncbi:hypothetical protein H2199_004327 [Coniosporium tulheliwenetii]|uniref:Uncharacterized protein n=1 Tax=Coniosporium tulheliwenetii TaxID=3383036 RepID=A0ACC2Z5F5_9PEZI|nr:hypothetical protein H2199_004327 [Cladosporium sp. JES 115]